MLIVRPQRSKPLPRFGPAAVAIGVFDGVHAAHRAVISSAVSCARRNRMRSVVLTFWPHPQGKESLYSLEHRLRIIAELGVDVCVVAAFTRRFAALSPRGFVRKFLIGTLGCRAVFVGENFRFGRNAAGDAALLEQLCRQEGIRCTVIPFIKVRGTVVSSSLIRRLISSGKLDAARRMLLRPVSVFGNVVKGSGRGKALGYPTANIDPHHEVTPPAGIYAVMAVLGRTQYRGLCYIGTKPTFRAHGHAEGAKKKINRSVPCFCIEVHVLTFKKNIYGKTLEVQFIKKIRGDKKFSSPEALIRQIHKDIARALILFRTPGNTLPVAP